MREAHAPDFAEPLLGWRCWRVAERGDGSPALTSVVRPVEWPGRSELVAGCLGSGWRWWPRRRSARDHRTPDAGCVCGIHAAANVAQALHYLDVYSGTSGRKPPTVLGVVKLWGTVLQCERGWRAAFAYPARLFVVPPRRPNDCDPHRLAEGLARYGVPVEVLTPDGGSLIDLLVARHEPVEFATPRLLFDR
jgi:hypothetical protein